MNIYQEHKIKIFIKHQDYSILLVLVIGNEKIDLDINFLDCEYDILSYLIKHFKKILSLEDKMELLCLVKEDDFSSKLARYRLRFMDVDFSKYINEFLVNQNTLNILRAYVN
jgi:hypothetical protein